MDDYRYSAAVRGLTHWFRPVKRGHYQSPCGMQWYGKEVGGYAGHATECTDCVRILEQGGGGGA